MARTETTPSGGGSKLRSALVGIAIALGLSGALTLGVVWYVDRDSSRRAATAPVEVIEAMPQTWRARRTTKNGYQVVYRFTAGGQTFEAIDDRNGWYKPDSAEGLLACYDPANPSDSDLRSPNGSECGKGLLF